MKRRLCGAVAALALVALALAVAADAATEHRRHRPRCRKGEKMCDGRCRPARFFTSDRHCGACRRHCSRREECQHTRRGFQCVARKYRPHRPHYPQPHRCNKGTFLCAGQCRAPAFLVNNNKHCGSCGRACPAGQMCKGVACVPKPPACVPTRSACATLLGSPACCAADALCVAQTALLGAPTVCAVPPTAPADGITPSNTETTISVLLAAPANNGGSTAAWKVRVTLSQVGGNQVVTITQDAVQGGNEVTFTPGQPADGGVVPELCGNSWTVAATWLNAAGPSSDADAAAPVVMPACAPTCVATGVSCTQTDTCCTSGDTCLQSGVCGVAPTCVATGVACTQTDTCCTSGDTCLQSGVCGVAPTCVVSGATCSTQTDTCCNGGEFCLDVLGVLKCVNPSKK